MSLETKLVKYGLAVASFGLAYISYGQLKDARNDVRAAIPSALGICGAVFLSLGMYDRRERRDDENRDRE